MIEFQCSCGERLRAQEKNAGRKCQCVKCGKSLRVPMVDVADESFAFDSDPPQTQAIKTEDATLARRSLSQDADSTATAPSSSYGWCRALQGLLAGTGALLFVITAFVLLFAFKDIGDNGFLRLPLWAVVIVGSIAFGFIELACAELLGGAVAYLLKHDCRP